MPLAVKDGLRLLGQPLGSLTYARGFYAKKMEETRIKRCSEAAGGRLGQTYSAPPLCAMHPPQTTAFAGIGGDVMINGMNGRGHCLLA